MNEKLKDIGIGILSWYGYDALKATLDSYKNAGILELFEEKIIFFQEINDEGRDIAKKYGFEAHGNNKNIGIYGGFRGLAETMKSQYVLLLENDWKLSSNLDKTYQHLNTSLELLKSGKANKIDLRNRNDEDLKLAKNDAQRKFYSYFPKNDAPIWKKFIAKIKRITRKRKTINNIGRAIYYLQNPHQKFKEIKYDEKLKYFFVSSKYKRWGNQAFMIKKNFFINTILKQVEKSYTPKKNLVNGYKNIECEMNDNHDYFKPPIYYIIRRKPILYASWWMKQNFTVAIPETGIFSHDRVGWRGHGNKQKNFKTRIKKLLNKIKIKYNKNIVYPRLKHHDAYKRGSVRWLQAAEKYFGGFTGIIKRKTVSPLDTRSKEELRQGGMIGGDRMSQHNYAPAYEKHLKRFLNKKELIIVECGILKGTGLAVWSILFPDADIVGMDIDTSNFLENKQVLKEKGAFENKTPKTLTFDTFDIDTSELVQYLNGRKIDIFIDNAMHKTSTIIDTLEAIYPLMEKKYVYFIEDNREIGYMLRSRGDSIRNKYADKCKINFYDELTVIENK